MILKQHKMNVHCEVSTHKHNILIAAILHIHNIFAPKLPPPLRSMISFVYAKRACEEHYDKF